VDKSADQREREDLFLEKVKRSLDESAERLEAEQARIKQTGQRMKADGQVTPEERQGSTGCRTGRAATYIGRNTTSRASIRISLGARSQGSSRRRVGRGASLPSL